MLESRSQRRVWYCGVCRESCASSGRDGDPLRRIPRWLARPEEPFEDREELFLLPVWVVGDSRGREWRIPALGIERLALVLGLAERLSSIARPWSPWKPPRELLRGGAELHFEEAFELAELLRQRDRGEEESDPLGAARLVDWPCVRRSSQLVELVGGRAASGRILDGLSAVAKGPALEPLVL
jgi:hypothetical protein